MKMPEYDPCYRLLVGGAGRNAEVWCVTAITEPVAVCWSKELPGPFFFLVGFRVP